MRIEELFDSVWHVGADVSAEACHLAHQRAGDVRVGGIGQQKHCFNRRSVSVHNRHRSLIRDVGS